MVDLLYFYYFQLTTFGETRDEALNTMTKALDSYVIRGNFGRDLVATALSKYNISHIGHPAVWELLLFSGLNFTCLIGIL